MASTVDSDLQELKRIIRSAASSIAKDSAPTVSTRVVRGKRQSKPVSGFFRHAGQPSLDSSVVYDSVQEAIRSRVDGHEQEQQALTGDTDNERNVGTDAELEELAASLRADYSPTRNEGGIRETGLETANRQYAERRGMRPTRVS